MAKDNDDKTLRDQTGTTGNQDEFTDMDERLDTTGMTEEDRKEP